MLSRRVCVPLMCCETDVDIRLFVIGSRESWSSCFGRKVLLRDQEKQQTIRPSSGFHSESPECTGLRSIYSLPYDGAVDSAVCGLAVTAEGLLSIPGKSVRDLWWTNWPWQRFFSQYVCVLLLV